MVTVVASLVAAAAHHIDLAGATGLIYELLVIAGIVFGAVLALKRWANNHMVDPVRKVGPLAEAVEKQTAVLTTQAECLRKQGEALTKLHDGQKVLKEGQEGIERRMDKFDAEFANNDGHSMRDSNDRTEAIARQVAHFLGLEVPEPGAPVIDHQSPESTHH